MPEEFTQQRQLPLLTNVAAAAIMPDELTQQRQLPRLTNVAVAAIMLYNA